MNITLDPLDGFQQLWGQFGVVFLAQLNSEVTVQIS